MKKYRFTEKEVEEMKSSILTHTQNDGTAWRLRWIYESFERCLGTKKGRANGARKLALYEQLTTSDRPNWLPTDQRRAALTGYPLTK